MKAPTEGNKAKNTVKHFLYIKSGEMEAYLATRLGHLVLVLFMLGDS